MLLFGKHKPFSVPAHMQSDYVLDARTLHQVSQSVRQQLLLGEGHVLPALEQ